jgi:hypothetical protein
MRTFMWTILKYSENETYFVMYITQGKYIPIIDKEMAPRWADVDHFRFSMVFMW